MDRRSATAIQEKMCERIDTVILQGFASAASAQSADLHCVRFGCVAAAKNDGGRDGSRKGAGKPQQGGTVSQEKHPQAGCENEGDGPRERVRAHVAAAHTGRSEIGYVSDGHGETRHLAE